MYPYGERDSSETAEMEKAASARVEANSKDVVQALGDMGERLTIRRRFGHPPDEIALEVAEWEPDLVVLGRRGLRGPARWLGSVSEHVLHHAKVPVLLVS
jgi:nucleotide-binding universal stress UspA family protein